MGNEASSQNATEEQTLEPAVQEPPWNPDDISDSSDEQQTIVTKSAPLRAEPKPPPNLSQPSPETTDGSGQHARSSPNRRLRSAGRGAVQNNGSLSDAEDIVTVRLETSLPEAADGVSDGRSGHDQKRRRNKFEQRNHTASLSSTNEESSVTEETEQTSRQRLRGEPAKNSTTGGRLQQTAQKTAQERVLCPLADNHDCQQTFASLAAAKRHAQLHLNRQAYSCPVCEKTYSRADKLKTHQTTHTREEIAEAVAEKNDGQQAAKSDDESLEDHDQASADEAVPQQELEGSPQDLHAAHLPQHPVSSYTKTNEAIDQSSTKGSMSSVSVFDQPVGVEVVTETPRPKSRLKRKRETPNGGHLTASSTDHAAKRKRQSLSPPTSVASVEAEDTAEQHAGDHASPQLTPTTKVTKSKLQRTGNLNGFAKPWTPGSQLYHPLLNPHSPRPGSSQRVQVIIPRSSQVESSSKMAKKRVVPIDDGLEMLTKEPASSARKKQPVAYTTPKGKRRAVSGVTYSSPSNKRDGEDEDDEAGSEPRDMATSIARKGTVGRRTHTKTAEMGETLSDSASDANDEDRSKKPYACQECHRSFETRDKLRKHEKRPNVHSRAKDHRCEDCVTAFNSFEALMTHQRATNHGDGTGYQGRKGNFSDGEVAKLHRWRDRFCAEYDINIPTFNQMMTDSCRRGNGFVWPYRHVTKANFLQEYYEILPHRNIRSMRRYRERAFQNVPENQEWTQEDDDELIQLVKELGQKWVEIGQRMTRTQDSVNQRWRFKLQYQGKRNQGEWTTSEEDQLKEAVAQVKKRLRLPLDPNADVRMPWDSVSKLLESTRTAQQCSNKWRLMYQTRKGNKFVKPSDTERQAGASSNMATPSKMSQRLAGNTPSTHKSISSSQTKHISEEFVQDSDEGEGIESGNPSSDDQSEHDEDMDKSKTPAVRRNPVPTQTPHTGKGLSQIFAQTQANTSALRAPTTVPRPHTQSDVPTPGIPIQHRTNSSPWAAVNVKSNEIAQEDENMIMAEPQSSDEEGKATKDAQDDATSESTSRASNSEADDDDKSSVASSSGLTPDSSSDLESNVSARSDEDESEDSQNSEDEMIRDTQNDSFIQSLRSPNSQPSSSSRPGQSSGAGTNKKYWEKIIRGEREESTTDSEDEGDIMHH